jgi:polyisoprenoid-binding protein YceI
MNSYLARIALTASLGAGLAFAAPAMAATYKIDSSHVHTAFEVNHLGFSTTMGQFDDVSGMIEFDEENLEASSVEVTIKTASVDTGHKERDEHLRKADFFDVENHPTMTFKSTAIEVTGEDTAKITGDLTLLGVTKPVVLDAKLNKKGEHPFDASRYVAGFAATTTIDRTAFGMDYAAPAIGKEIKISIAAEAIRQ